MNAERLYGVWQKEYACRISWVPGMPLFKDLIDFIIGYIVCYDVEFEALVPPKPSNDDDDAVLDAEEAMTSAMIGIGRPWPGRLSQTIETPWKPSGWLTFVGKHALNMSCSQWTITFDDELSFAPKVAFGVAKLSSLTEFGGEGRVYNSVSGGGVLVYTNAPGLIVTGSDGKISENVDKKTFDNCQPFGQENCSITMTIKHLSFAATVSFTIRWPEWPTEPARTYVTSDIPLCDRGDLAQYHPFISTCKCVRLIATSH
jgi:hypothetical protein